MRKSEAISMFANSTSCLARAIGITTQAISQWPEELPPRIEDRVIAALAREGRLHTDMVIAYTSNSVQ
ncbi:MAG: Cro/CI family transcriptional regulator [bacterium]